MNLKLKVIRIFKGQPVPRHSLLYSDSTTGKKRAEAYKGSYEEWSREKWRKEVDRGQVHLANQSYIILTEDVGPAENEFGPISP